MQLIAKVLIFIGIILIGVGLFLTFFDKIPFLGKLPGDIFIKRKNFSFYFPITTSILVSLILTLILRICSKK
ncbi:MAG: DUF2905 domain-containing protein [Candidatus Omnitrophota bacterium]